MTKFYTLFLILFCSTTLANVNVTVSVPIHSEHNSLVMLNAKTKAAQMSVDKLPSVIWGEESLRNNQYAQTIKAIGFSHADVEVLTETWDHKSKELTITANVTWNEEKVKQTLKSVQEGEQAKRTVSQIEMILNGISARDFLNNNAHRKHEEARLLASPFHFGMDLKAYVSRYNETLNQMIEMRKERLIEYIKLIVITPQGMRNQKLHYAIDFPDLAFLQLSFESDDLQRFYSENIDTIENSYKLCFVTTAPAVKGWKLPISHESKTPVYRRSISIDPIPHLLSGRVAPIYYLPCK